METSDVLTSWKEIAAYLKKGVRTVQRWEAELNLPVRRPVNNRRKTVVAVPAELDNWVASELSVRNRDGEASQEAPVLRSVESKNFRYRVLVVDDDPEFREMMQVLLESSDYEVLLGEDGFAGLSALKVALPDLIISDLRMPNMSGFEFLAIVRHRFPRIPVLAISGEFTGIGVPGSVLADAHLQKGAYSVSDLLETVRELLNETPRRPREGKSKVPVWIPKPTIGRFVVVTCPDCLRSFPALQTEQITAGVHHSLCDFCSSEITFEITESESGAKAAD